MPWRPQALTMPFRITTDSRNAVVAMPSTDPETPTSENPMRSSVTLPDSMEIPLLPLCPVTFPVR